jgi:hypothetical protein
MKKVVLSIAMFAAFSGAAVAVPTTSLTPNNLTGLTPNRTASIPGFDTGLGSFAEYFSFQISAPASEFRANGNYIGNAQVLSGLMATLFAAADCSGSSCVGSGLGSSTMTSATEWTLDWRNVTAGYYVLKISGSSTQLDALVSGQVATRVPAPAVLGLVGLGLVGVGFFGSRRRG